MTTDDAQAAAGTVEGQGPVEIDEDVARHLANKREGSSRSSKFATSSPGGDGGRGTHL